MPTNLFVSQPTKVYNTFDVQIHLVVTNHQVKWHNGFGLVKKRSWRQKRKKKKKGVSRQNLYKARKTSKLNNTVHVVEAVTNGWSL